MRPTTRTCSVQLCDVAERVMASPVAHLVKELNPVSADDVMVFVMMLMVDKWVLIVGLTLTV